MYIFNIDTKILFLKLYSLRISCLLFTTFFEILISFSKVIVKLRFSSKFLTILYSNSPKFQVKILITNYH